jgi:hypothetical protein
MEIGAGCCGLEKQLSRCAELALHQQQSADRPGGTLVENEPEIIRNG